MASSRRRVLARGNSRRGVDGVHLLAFNMLVAAGIAASFTAGRLFLGVPLRQLAGELGGVVLGARQQAFLPLVVVFDGLDAHEDKAAGNGGEQQEVAEVAIAGGKQDAAG